MNQQDVLSQALISLVQDVAMGKESDELLLVSKLIYSRLFYIIWYRLTQAAQGSQVATGACLPLWEVINFLASDIIPVNSETRGYLMSLFTSLYHKFKDKRCFYQQVCKFNSPVSTVSLTSCTHRILNLSARELHLEDNLLSPLFKSILSFSISGLRQDQIEHSREKVSPIIFELVKIIPSFILSNNMDEILVSSNAVTLPLRKFQYLIWRSLTFCDALRINVGKDLESVLLDSPWSMKPIVVSGVEKKYKHFFSSLSRESRLLDCLGSPLMDVPVDNKPLLDIQTVKQLTMRQRYCTMKKENWISKVPLRGAVFTSQKRKIISDEEAIFTRIRSDIEFEQSSSICRTCDELTVLCRDLVFKFNTHSKKAPMEIPKSQLYKNLLFTRNIKGKKYLPSFIPQVAQSKLNLLEMIFTNSAKEVD